MRLESVFVWFLARMPNVVSMIAIQMIVTEIGAIRFTATGVMIAMVGGIHEIMMTREVVIDVIDATSIDAMTGEIVHVEMTEETIEGMIATHGMIDVTTEAETTVIDEMNVEVVTTAVTDVTSGGLMMIEGFGENTVELTITIVIDAATIGGMSTVISVDEMIKAVIAVAIFVWILAKLVVLVTAAVVVTLVSPLRSAHGTTAAIVRLSAVPQEPVVLTNLPVMKARTVATIAADLTRHHSHRKIFHPI